MYRDIGTRDYVVKDQLASDQHVVSMDLLEKESFDMSGWFTEQRMRTLGLTGRSSHQCLIRDVIAIVTRKLLTDGVSSSYPCTNTGLNPVDRFWVQRAEGNADEYLILDADLEVDTSIPKAWLEEPTFNLVSWYRLHLDQREFFEQQYYEAHHEAILQQRTPANDEWHTCSFSHELQGCPG